MCLSFRLHTNYIIQASFFTLRPYFYRVVVLVLSRCMFTVFLYDLIEKSNYGKRKHINSVVLIHQWPSCEMLLCEKKFHDKYWLL